MDKFLFHTKDHDGKGIVINLSNVIWAKPLSEKTTEILLAHAGTVIIMMSFDDFIQVCHATGMIVGHG